MVSGQSLPDEIEFDVCRNEFEPDVVLIGLEVVIYLCVGIDEILGSLEIAHGLDFKEFSCKRSDSVVDGIPVDGIGAVIVSGECAFLLQIVVTDKIALTDNSVVAETGSPEKTGHE